MKLARKVGATSQIFQIFVRDSSSTTGAGLAGLTNASASLTAYYHRDTDTTATVIALVTMTVGTFTSSGFKEIDATNMPGWYQFCPPNAALASGAASVGFHLKGATNMAPLPIEVDLDAQVDVTLWNGTAVASPATAGIPDVNVKNMNNVAATSITTVNANQGTTQPQNFTGTGASALVKTDMVDIAGAAVSATVAQIGVNTVNLGGTAQTGRDIGASVLVAGDFSATMKTSLNASTPAAITGAVGSVTARVTANTDQLAGQTVTAAAGVTFPASVASPTNITAGTITTATNLTNAPTVGDFTATMKTSLNAATPASVVGAVGSVTGNVGGNVNGNVAGSVGSVTAAVTVGTNNDKTGYALSAGGVQAIWDVLTSALTTVGSIGKLLAALPGSIWDVVLSGHLTAGTTGAALNSAGSAGDPWATALPGAYASGSAGNIVGNRLDVAVSTRLATSGYTAPDNSDITAIKAKTDNLPASPAATGAAMTLTAAYDAAKTAAQVSDIPTAIQNADALLKRDMSAVTGEAARSPLNALRFLRNKWTLVSTLLTVTKEDDTTTAWTGSVGSTAGADPVTSVDPT